MIFRLLAATMLCGTIATTAHASDKAANLRDQEQAACYDDAQKLCGDAMPDVDKVTECMKPKKAQVSAKCAAFYK